MTQEELARLRSIYGSRGIDFGTVGGPSDSPASKYLPATATPLTEESPGLNDYVHEALKGAVSGYTGELADLAAHAAGSDIMEQDPNNLLPYRAGYVAGSLVGLPQKLALGATRLVGSRLLPNAGLMTKAAVSNALAGAGLAGVSAAGQGEDVIPAIETGGLLGLALGPLGVKLEGAINRMAGRNIAPAWSKVDPEAAVTPDSSTATVDESLAGRMPPPRPAPAAAPTARPTVGRTDILPPPRQTGRSYAQAAQESLDTINPPPPPGPPYPMDLDPADLSRLGQETRNQNMRQLDPKYAIQPPVAEAPPDLESNDRIRNFVMGQLNRVVGNSGNAFKLEAAYAAKYLEALLKRVDKKSLPKPEGELGPDFKKLIDGWIAEGRAESKRIFDAALAQTDVAVPVAPTVTATQAATSAIPEPATLSAPPIAPATGNTQSVFAIPTVAGPGGSGMPRSPMRLTDLVEETQPIAPPIVQPQSVDDLLSNIRGEMGMGSSPLSARRATPGNIPPIASGPTIRVAPTGEALAADALPVPLSPIVRNLPSPYRRFSPELREERRRYGQSLLRPKRLTSQAAKEIEGEVVSAGLPEAPETSPLALAAATNDAPEFTITPPIEAAPVIRAPRRRIIRPQATEAPEQTPVQEPKGFGKKSPEGVAFDSVLSPIRRFLKGDFSKKGMLDRMKREKGRGVGEGRLAEEMENLEKIRRSAKWPQLPGDWRNEAEKALKAWEEAAPEFNPRQAAREVGASQAQALVESLREAGRTPEQIASQLVIRMRKQVGREIKGNPELEEKGIIQKGDYQGLAEVERPQVREAGEKTGPEFLAEAGNLLNILVGPDRAEKLMRAVYSQSFPKSLREPARKVLGRNDEAFE